MRQLLREERHVYIIFLPLSSFCVCSELKWRAALKHDHRVQRKGQQPKKRNKETGLKIACYNFCPYYRRGGGYIVFRVKSAPQQGFSLQLC